MRLHGWIMPLFAFTLPVTPVVAAEPERHAESVPKTLIPPVHTLARAGNPNKVAWWAIPSVTRFDTGGYVGGGSLHGNNVLARGADAVTGPICTGTFGSDFTGLRTRPGRVFLAPSADPSHGRALARHYRSEVPIHVPDPIALRPLRKAILEQHEAVKEKTSSGKAESAVSH
jgi:hypothetical protein